MALPGTLNYIEGQASIGTQVLNVKSIGSDQLQAGQTLATQNGKAEILLTPGVFLRLDDHSSAKMISPNLTNTELAIARGEAMVEVAEIHKANDIRIVEDGATTRLLKTGVYDFDAVHGQVRVFDGKAVVQDGDREVNLKGGRELTLNTPGELKARKFDKKGYEASDLYRWSSLRSSYLAEASAQTAQIYVADGWYGPGWLGAGWYWDPWFSAYTFIPADGMLFSPFGWGFYSPLVVYRAPVYWGGHRYFRDFDRGQEGRGLDRGTAGFHGPAMRAPSMSGFGEGFHGGIRTDLGGRR
ncbi:MAG TPA: FecR domain-containing protein [Terriglobales bacterium]|jgi:hypothetical protein|nr:FecR domain-containing protein [Terriglobales bacterium]